MRIEKINKINNIIELNKYMDDEGFALKSIEYDENFEKCNIKYVRNNEAIDIVTMVHNSDFEFGVPYKFEILNVGLNFELMMKMLGD